MGYRSDVAYVIEFEDLQTLNEFIALVMVKGGAEKEALSECLILPKDCRICYCVDDVKWYEHFTQVQAHTWLYNYAVERFGTERAGYEFVRIGEETNDIEWESAGDIQHGSIAVNRSLDLPFEYDYEPVGDALSVVEESHAKT
jgi:hypothetical protein